jgi:hypothetical protein
MRGRIAILLSTLFQLDGAAIVKTILISESPLIVAK